jgi:hypothetical protein
VNVESQQSVVTLLDVAAVRDLALVVVDGNIESPSVRNQRLHVVRAWTIAPVMEHHEYSNVKHPTA